MEKENFIKILNCIRKIDDFDDCLNKAGLEFFNTDCFDSICRMERILLEEIYTKEGYEWIEWYLYDLPQMKKDNPDKNDFAWDENKKPIILNDDADLYTFLEKEYMVTGRKKDKNNKKKDGKKDN